MVKYSAGKEFPAKEIFTLLSISRRI